MLFCENIEGDAEHRVNNCYLRYFGDLSDWHHIFLFSPPCLSRRTPRSLREMLEDENGVKELHLSRRTPLFPGGTLRPLAKLAEAANGRPKDRKRTIPSRQDLLAYEQFLVRVRFEPV